MTGLDSNVLVRYIMQDDTKQSARASRLLESFTPEDPGFVPLVVVTELFWVLSGAYALSRDQIAQALEALLQTKELVVDRADQVLRALRVFKTTSADFADCLIVRGAVGAGCTRTMTFDVSAAKTSGMTLIPG